MDGKKTDKQLREKRVEIYKRHGIPYEIMYYCGELLRHHYKWAEIDGDCPEVSQTIYQQIINWMAEEVNQLDGTKADKDDVTFLFLHHIRLAIEKLEEMNKRDPCILIRKLKRCFEEEETLHQVYEDTGRQWDEPIKEPSPVDILLKQVYSLRADLENLEKELFTVDGIQQKFNSEFPHLNGQIQQCDTWMKKPPNGQKLEDVNQKKNNLVILRDNLTVTTCNHRVELLKKYLNMVENLQGIEASMAQQVDDWKKCQRLEKTGLAVIPEGRLKELNILCGECGAALISCKQQLEQFKIIYEQAKFQNDQFRKKPEEMLRQLELILHQHTTDIIVIDKQPQSVLKVIKGKSVAFQLSVKILGGKSLSLHTNQPRLHASVRKEEHMRTGDYKSHICDIINFQDKIMVWDPDTDMVSAQATSVELSKMPRNTKQTKEDSVTDYMYGMVFTITLNVANKEYMSVILSHPFVVVTQTSQFAAATPVILWYCAFSEQSKAGGPPYVVPERKSWGDVATMLNAFFKKNTGRGLTENQLKYLGRRALDTDDTKDIMKREISRDQLCKRKMQGKDFSFWKWFYACNNLMKEYLHKEWQDGLIHGFMSKKEANALLHDKPTGTFLLRPSESDIENSQSMNLAGCLTLAVVDVNPNNHEQTKVFHVKEHLRAQDLSKPGLAQTLDAMEVRCHDNMQMKKRLLETLCENPGIGKQERKFDEAFKPYIVEHTTLDKGYYSTRFKIEIYLHDAMKSSTHVAPHVSPPSPMISNMGSPQAFSPGSPGTMGVASPELVDIVEESAVEAADSPVPEEQVVLIDSDNVLQMGLCLQDEVILRQCHSVDPLMSQNIVAGVEEMSLDNHLIFPSDEEMREVPGNIPLTVQEAGDDFIMVSPAMVQPEPSSMIGMDQLTGMQRY